MNCRKPTSNQWTSTVFNNTRFVFGSLYLLWRLLNRFCFMKIVTLRFMNVERQRICGTTSITAHIRCFNGSHNKFLWRSYYFKGSSAFQITRRQCSWFLSSSYWRVLWIQILQAPLRDNVTRNINNIDFQHFSQKIWKYKGLCLIAWGGHFQRLL